MGMWMLQNSPVFTTYRRVKDSSAFIWFPFPSLCPPVVIPTLPFKQLPHSPFQELLQPPAHFSPSPQPTSHASQRSSPPQHQLPNSSSCTFHRDVASCHRKEGAAASERRLCPFWKTVSGSANWGQKEGQALLRCCTSAQPTTHRATWDQAQRRAEEVQQCKQALAGLAGETRGTF